MAAAALKVQLNNHIAAMFAAGSVEKQFNDLLAYQANDEDSAGLIREVVGLFVRDADRLIGLIAGALEGPVVDFGKLNEYIHTLRGSSGSVGAIKVYLAVHQFGQFIDVKSRDGCLMVFALVRNEYYDIRNKFQTILQLEEQIEAAAKQ